MGRRRALSIGMMADSAQPTSTGSSDHAQRGSARKQKRAMSINDFADGYQRRSARVAARETMEEIADLKGSAGSKAPPKLPSASTKKGRRRAKSIGHFVDGTTNRTNVAGKKKLGASRARAMSIMDFADAGSVKIGTEKKAGAQVGRRRQVRSAQCLEIHQPHPYL